MSADENEEQLKIMKKRGFIVKEIVSTEVTYVERLQFAVDVIICPLRENNLLDSNDLLAQFSIMEKICALHSTHSITEVESNPEKLGEFFHNICDNVQIYTDYLVNYESAMQRRCSLLISNRRFSDFLDKAEKDPRLQNQKIESIFILPVQRIPRYRLLLEQLLKYTPGDHPQFNDVQRALDKICDMAMYSNEAIRARENRAKIMDIIKTIEPRTRVDLLADPDRSFLKEGPLLRQCRRGLKEFHFWLFNDQLLYGQATPLGLYILNRQIQLTKCYVNPCESMHEEGYSFIVESPAKSFIICFTTEAEKTEWYDAIQGAIVALNKARQSKQKAQYAPLWMPDKSAATCQKCRNAFSLINRRHHCRNCGAIVCDNCSKKRIKLEHVDQHRQVRACDACHLYLTSSGAQGAKNSLRMDSLRLRSGNYGADNTNTSTAAVMDEEEDELYVSDVDDEDIAEREQLDEDDLNDFNDVLTDPVSLQSLQKQASIGSSSTTFRDNNPALPPTLLQQMGKGLTGVISFTNPTARGAPRPPLMSSASLRFPAASSSASSAQDDTRGRSNSDEVNTTFTPPKPPKPAHLSAKSEPVHSPVPMPSPPPPRGPPGGRPGIMRSVSAFVTSGTTFLTTGSMSSPTAPTAAAAAAPVSSPAVRSLPATPIRPVDIPMEEIVHHKQDSPSSNMATTNSAGVDHTTSTVSAASVTSEDAGDSEERPRAHSPPPPAKPPKPQQNRMSRRTNICITLDEAELAKAAADLLLEEQHS